MAFGTAPAYYDADVSHARRFPVPPPPLPMHGDGDLAAQRRRELLWELQKEHIRQDMILRELVERERAMAARFSHPVHWPTQAFRKPTSTAQATELKRKRSTATSGVTTKKQRKKKPKWTCNLGQVILHSPREQVNHRAGKKRHLSKLKARKNKPAAATPCSPPLRRNGGASMIDNKGGGRPSRRRAKQRGGGSKNAPRPAEDEDQVGAPSLRWTCRVCNAKCSFELVLHDHLSAAAGAVRR